MLRKILIVEDNNTNRMMLKMALSDSYDIMEASDGKEALELLHRFHKSLSAVLLDIVMPVMDGYEVLAAVRGNAVLSQLPILVLTGNAKADSETKALELGATDFIVKPYNFFTIKQRLRNIIKLRETAAIVNAMQRDRLTGLYSRDTFFEKVKEMLRFKPSGYYVLAAIDIDNFKVINDLYGTPKGDEILRKGAHALKRCFEPHGGICCRIEGDNFAVLYPSVLLDSNEIAKITAQVALVDVAVPPITCSIGRYVIVDRTLPVSAMYDRAVLAQLSIKGRYDVREAMYDESMRDNLLREQQIVTEMKDALSEGQFEVWFQPQYNHMSKSLVGAEALVRWRHPIHGIIPPNDFIPVFERNGFIYEMDKYVWDQTAAYIHEWLQMGRPPIPVSVNISRQDIFRADFYETITGLIAKHNIPINLLRLEITETAFSNSTEQIVNTVKRLKEFGFVIEIDDFGSGYSSLNVLKDVPAHVLKLDMKFLAETGDAFRSGSILESIVRMAKWLSMNVIAEGVETKEQADYLKSIGCNCIQGYYYAKPMPCKEYEALSVNATCDEEPLLLTSGIGLSENMLWDVKSMDNLVFNTYAGGACIFEYCNGKVELLRVNDQYLAEMEISVANASKLDSIARIDPINHLDIDNMRIVEDNILKAIATKNSSVCETCFLKEDGRRIWIQSAVRLVAQAGDRYLFYCVTHNVTRAHDAEQKQCEAETTLQDILAKVGDVATADVEQCRRALLALQKLAQQNAPE